MLKNAPLSLKNKRIILSKINQIGDVIFALPLAYLLKQVDPTCHIIFLGQAYTQSLIESCLDIDEFANWTEIQNKNNFSLLSLKEKAALFQNFNADIFINIYPNKTIAQLAKLAKIPIRIGTSHRLFHWWTCNYRVSLSRKKSPLHESQLDLYLLKALGLRYQYSLDEIIPMRRFSLEKLTKKLSLQEIQTVEKFLDQKKFNLILHPLTRGRHIEWPLKSFDALCDRLNSEKFNILMTGTAAEGEIIRPVLMQKKRSHVQDTTGQLTLNQLIYLIFKINGLVCASTGPIHIAAALNKSVLGLYAPIKPFDAGRWGPIGEKAEVLCIEKKCEACRVSLHCECIKKIPVSMVLEKINHWI